MNGRTKTMLISNSDYDKQRRRSNDVGCPAPAERRKKTSAIIPCAEQALFATYPWLKYCDNVCLTRPSN